MLLYGFASVALRIALESIVAGRFERALFFGSVQRCLEGLKFVKPSFGGIKQFSNFYDL